MIYYEELTTRQRVNWKVYYPVVDESPIPVLKSAKKGATHKGYYWVYYDSINHTSGESFINRFKTTKLGQAMHWNLLDVSMI